MRDIVSIARVKKLHPAIREKVVVAIDKIERGFPAYIAVRVTQGFRTFPEQDHLYALGRTIKNPDGYDARKKPLGNIVTKAKSGSSFHNYGLAIDFAILYDKDRNGVYEEISWSMVRDGDLDGIADWTEIKDVFLALGFSWGGNWRTFKDYPHVEMTFGFTYKDLLTRYRKKDFIPGTEYINLTRAA
jgi:peptidoglycan L-alanyl-D-glutamate endopeptidase CwlK